MSQSVANVVVDDLALMLTTAVVDGRAIAAAVADQRRLIVLDNCEHVLDAVGEIAGQLLDRCPNVALLATSRERLGVTGEQRVAMQPLSVDCESGPSDAARLFFTRAAEADISFDPTPEEQATIEGICARLDGLPLALELAATRVCSVGLSQVEARIAGGIDRVEQRGGPARHRSLAAAMQWSYELLDPDERTIFERLSVFADGFDLAAAMAVAGAEPFSRRVDDVLVSLVDKSLVAVAHRSPIRYRQLEVIRQFAADQLAASGEVDVIEDRFVHYYTQWLEQADVGVRGTDEAVWDGRMRSEWANLRHALRRAVTTGDVDSAGSIVWHAYWWAIQRSRLEVGDWADAVRGMGGIAGHPLHAILVAAAGEVARRRHDNDLFVRLVAEAEQIEAVTGAAHEPWVQQIAVSRDAIYHDVDPSPAVIELERPRRRIALLACACRVGRRLHAVRARRQRPLRR